MSSSPRPDDDIPTAFTQPITTPLLVRGSSADVGCLPLSLVFGTALIALGTRVAWNQPWDRSSPGGLWFVGGLFLLHALVLAVWRLPAPPLLLEMLDRVCLGAALRWRMELLRGPVKWTSRLRFLHGGLEYRTKDLFGDNETVTVPYRLTSYEISNSVFQLFTPEQKRPVSTVSTGEVNFFPGLLLLAMLRADGRLDAENTVTQPPRLSSTEPRDERIRREEGGFCAQRRR